MRVTGYEFFCVARFFEFPHDSAWVVHCCGVGLGWKGSVPILVGCVGVVVHLLPYGGLILLILCAR